MLTKCTVKDNIATIQIDRPNALNALNRQVVDEIDDYIETVKADKNIRVLVIYSEGNFAAGADIKSMVECNEEEARAFSFSYTFNKIETLEIPTIAVIEGYALGGGLELALTCDLIIASENSKMGFPEITLGIMPGAGGTARAPRAIGLAKAKQLIFLGEIIDAQKAEKMGIINVAVPSNELLPLAKKWAEKMSRLSGTALRMAKRTIDAAYMEADVIKGIEIESNNWAALFSTDDQKEGMRAFVEKRKPVFNKK